MLVSDWTNPARPTDVNNDLVTTPIDALLVINAVSRAKGESSLGPRTNRLGHYLDTSGDARVTALDALRVINEVSRSKRSQVNQGQRIEGEAELAPAGFISIVMGTLPGRSDQVVSLMTQMTVGREEFNEMGLFLMDGPAGTVHGVSPSSSNYANEVFASDMRQVLYSKKALFSTANETVFPAGATLGVYVLQATTDNGDADKHLRARSTGVNQFRIGWEEFASASSWASVGDRGFDDAMVNVQIGTPVDGNAAPVITAIADRSINEQVTFTLQPVVRDIDLPADKLTYKLDKAPVGATIDSATGKFTWTPTEAQGPGVFDVTIRVTDRKGAFDTEDFKLTVLEVNLPPVLSNLTDQSVALGGTVRFTATATDPDLPANTVRYRLGPGAPTEATIDSVTGQFTWPTTATTSTVPQPVTIIVADNGSPALSDSQTINLTAGNCAFDATLSGWATFESGGTTAGKGAVVPQACSAIITEGNSFVVGLEQAFTIPTTPSAISITYRDLAFDQTSNGFIRDALEFAILDESGNSLVKTFVNGKDAFFNATEGLSVSTATGIQTDTGSATVGLGGLVPGTKARLVMRLVNEDGDIRSRVAITSTSIIPSSLQAVPAEGQSSKRTTDTSAGIGPQTATNIGTNIVPNVVSAIGVVGNSSASTSQGSDTTPPKNSTPQSVKLIPISTPFNSPIGIDYHSLTNSVVVSVNYSSGSPLAFERIDSDGNHTQFSTVSGLGDEVKIATVRPGNVGGFKSGDLFSGNGVDGEILRISADGLQVDNPWVSLPGDGNGLMRGSLHVDRTGVFGGDLIAVTTVGEIWRINASGQPNKLASVGVHLEGLDTVPNEPNRYGPLAGKIIAGAEEQGVLYAIDPQGIVTTFSPGVNIEDIDIVPASENFFGVNFGSSRILGAAASAFKSMVGDILLTQESHDGSGLFRLYWDGTSLKTESLGLSTDSASASQWEHVTFSPSGIAEIAPVPQPPTLTVQAPVRSTQVGQQVLLSGLATAFGQSAQNVPNRIQEVYVNGVPVDVLDSNGNFYFANAIQAGVNTFVFEAIDEIGQSVVASLSIEGIVSTPGQIDFSHFVDNTAAFKGVYQRTSFNEGTKELHVDLATRNDGTFVAKASLLVGVKNISDPTVSVVAADGTLPDGTKYYDYSDVADEDLAPQKVSTPIGVIFHNPQRVKFTYELVYLSQLNAAPVITSVPDIEALVGKPYSYPLLATDADGDTLNYKLVESPTGMSINPNTGLVAWTPTPTDIGNRNVVIKVSDGRGGLATQRYTLTVAVPPPNRPPVITSSPVTSVTATSGPSIPTQAGVEFVYRYDVDAIDPDSDILTFSLPVFPSGMKIDSGSGLITWIPSIAQIGENEVQVQVSDGRGGVATQEFIICVDPDPSNHAPVIVSQPIVQSLTGTYQYDVDAVDADNNSLVYSLVDPPTGMTIDPPTGMITWQPGAITAEQPVTVSVSDNRGGTDKQSFKIAIARGTGEIHGTKFNDRNGDGRQTTGPAIGANFVQNGSFEKGIIGANSDYLHTPQGNVDEGTWWVTPADPGGPWGPPRSAANVGRLNANGDDSASAGTKRVWHQSVTVQAGKFYDFSAWAWATHEAADGYQLRFAFDDAQIGDILSASQAQIWESFNAIYQAKKTGPVVISIVNVSGKTFPNDFMLDDISLVEVGTSDLGLANWTIYLDQNQNTRRDAGELSTTTDTNGDYAFTGLAVDTYIVREEYQAGWRQTYPANATGSQQVALTSGQRAQGIDFGNVAIAAGPNQLPRITSTPPSLVTFGDLLQYNVKATDPENDPLTYSLITSHDGMTVHPSLGVVVWQPQALQIGKHQVVVQVKDGRGGVAIQTFELNVLAPNNGPVFTSVLPDQAVRGRKLAFDVLAQDADGDAVTISLDTGSVGVITAIPTKTLDGKAGPTRYRFEWTPTAADVTAGTRRIAFQAKDARNGSAQIASMVPVVAIAANRAPTIDSAPLTAAYPGVQYAYPVHADDPDGNPLTYTLTTKPVGMTISTTGLITWTPPTSTLTAQAVAVSVSDGLGGTVTQSFTITPRSALDNTRPTIVSNPRLSVREGQPYIYDALAQDDQGDPILWSLDTAPLGMSISSTTGQIRWIPREDQLGTHTVVLRAADPLGAFALQSFAVDVRCVNTPPVIVSTPPTQAYAGDLYLYGVRASDADDDPLSFKLISKIPGMSITDRGVIRWTPAASDVGTPKNVVVQVKDDSDGIVIQKFDLVVSAATNRNRPPVIESAPTFLARLGSAYKYQVTASDADGDKLEYFLTTKSPWMTIIKATGEIKGTPTTAGIDTVVVEVRDARGAVATQGFAVNVRANQLPQITSSPATAAIAGATYRYAINATDIDGDSLVYTFQADKGGLQIDSQGRISWNVPADFAKNGPVPIQVTAVVTDPYGGEARQTFTLTVAADTEKPHIVLQTRSGSTVFNTDGQVDLGSTTTVRVIATDNVGIAEMSLEVDGKLVPLNGVGEATIDASRLGTIQLRARAKDAAGNVGEQLNAIHVATPGSGNSPTPSDPTLPPNSGPVPGDTGRPLVSISSPAIGKSVTNIEPIMGTIDDPENHLWFWRVYTARVDAIDIHSIDVSDPDLTQISQGTNEIIAGEIAKFDPTNLDNDSYVILVAAYDLNGTGYVAATIVNVEGNVKLGQFNLDFTDLTIPLAGIPIQVSRVYDTRQAGREGDFGFGWTLGVQDARILEVAAIGEDGAFGSGEGTFIPDKTKVYLTNPSGQRVGFTYKEEPTSASLFGGINRPYFVADPGVYDKLTIDETSVGRGGILGELVGGINPSHYTLTQRDGTIYRYGETSGLETITDRNGQTVTFSQSGITHSLGESIQFVRDNRGRIKEIIDPDGKKVLYEYNAAGNLIKVTNQVGLKSTYTYLDKPAHYLDEGFDDLGKRDFKVTYDSQGRFKAVIDALGNPVSRQNYDELASRRATVLDANGNVTKLLYNDRGNVLEETDAAGNKTIREYKDAKNPDLETRIIDRRGMVTNREYDASGNVMKISEHGPQSSPFAVPIVTEFAYNTKNDVTSIKNADGTSTVFNYDDKGNVTKIVNGLGNSSTFTYDDQGRRASFTDFNGNTTTFDYENGCPCGSPHKSTNADDTYQTFEYNQFGQVTEEKSFEKNGTLVEQKQTFYDASGRVTREVVGGGSDALHPATDVRKFYTGNLLDWEIIVNPSSLNTDGSLKESPVTPVAQRKSRITDYDYDAADRLIKQTDAMGGIVNFRYDAQGNRVLLQDPVGNITTWTYDVLNRVAEERDPFYWVSFVQSHSTLSADQLLDAVVVENKKASGASLANNQGAAHVRSFGYDAEGNQAEVIDRNNRRREFSYNYAGRLLEERWYAANNGEQVETIKYTYDQLGNMLTAQNASSKYVYTYDTLNRVKSVDNQDSNPDTPHVILYYDYDAQGNVIKTSDDVGVTVASSYSKRNQLETRKWFDGLIPTGGTADVADARIDFSYNAAGRQKQIRRYSDLTATTKVGSTDYTYDLAGRTDKLIHKNAVDALLSSYDYNYDFSGLVVGEIRDHQDNKFDDNITYKYDLTGQLVDAAFNAQDDEHYVYDLNGNRILSVNGTDSRTYTTVTANQLNSDSVYRYTYDGEGNLKIKTKISDGQVTENFWDHHNRLVIVEERSAGGIIQKTVEYRYDVEGRRITEIINGTVTLRAVHNGDDTWGDFDSDGHSNARYLFTNYVDNLLSIYQTDRLNWQLTDRLSTIRSVVESSGVLESELSYDGFGNLLTPDINSSRFAFSGREWQTSTGIYYFRRRSFDASIGRFTSIDPIGFASGEVNLFRYTTNSPVNFRDPSGLLSIESIALLITTTGGAALGASGAYTQGGSGGAIALSATVGGVLGLTGGLFGAVGGEVLGQIIGGAYSPQKIKDLDFNELSVLAAFAVWIAPEILGYKLIATETAILGLGAALTAEGINRNAPISSGPLEELYRASVRAVREVRQHFGY